MLDAFTEVLVKHAAEQSEVDELTELMFQLPLEEAAKFASGEVSVKNAYVDLDGKDWLKKYEGTPLFERALELEEAMLKIEADDIEKRMADRQQNDSIWDKKDMLRLKKRMLDLELHKGGMSKGEDDEDEEEEEEDEAVAEPVPEEPKEAEARFTNALVHGFHKEASVLNPWKPFADRAKANDAARAATPPKKKVSCSKMASVPDTTTAMVEFVRSEKLAFAPQPQQPTLGQNMRRMGRGVMGAGRGAATGALGGGLGGAALGGLAGAGIGALTGDVAGGAMRGAALGGAGGALAGGAYGAMKGHRAAMNPMMKRGSAEEDSIDLAGRSIAHAFYKKATSRTWGQAIGDTAAGMVSSGWQRQRQLDRQTKQLQAKPAPTAAAGMNPAAPPVPKVASIYKSAMNPMQARERLALEAEIAGERLPMYGDLSPEDVALAEQAMREQVTSDIAHQRTRAEGIKAHPVKHRLRWAAGGAVPGAIVGGLAGAGGGPKRALKGAGIGALAGGALGAAVAPSAGRLENYANLDEAAIGALTPEMAQRYIAAANAEARDWAGHQRSMDVARAGASNVNVTQNANMGLPPSTPPPLL